jgi:biotin carboxylase
MKDIFILAGSEEQFELIFEAKRLCFTVHLFDADKECLGKNYADFFYHIDIADKEAILQKALEIKPVAVLTIATEIGNITSCYVSEKLNLPTNGYNVALNTTNKLKMKDIAKDNYIKTAPYKKVSLKEDLSWNFFPCIIKPADSSAGRGVSFINSSEDFEDAIKLAVPYSRTKTVLVEEYIKGVQFSIETISVDKKHHILAITEEYISKPPRVIETQQLLPARIDKELEKKIEEFALNVLKAFNISFGACHIEIKIDDKGEIYLIEIASRVGGWRSELINLAFGISYCQLLIFSALNKKIEFEKSRKDFAIVKLILSQKDFEEYEYYLDNFPSNVFSRVKIDKIKESKHLSDLNGFYFLHIQDKNQLGNFIKEHK